MRSIDRRIVVVGAALIAVVALAAGLVWWWNAQRGREVVFAVPPGTVARLAAGERVEVLPQTITLRRNDTLVIRNDDTQPVQIGPFPIAPGQRFVQQYVDAGTIDLVCSVHQGERLRIVVE